MKFNTLAALSLAAGSAIAAPHSERGLAVRQPADSSTDQPIIVFFDDGEEKRDLAVRDTTSVSPPIVILFDDGKDKRSLYGPSVDAAVDSAVSEKRDLIARDPDTDSAPVVIFFDNGDEKRELAQRDLDVEKRGLGTLILLGATFGPTIYNAIKNAVKRDVETAGSQPVFLYIPDGSDLSTRDLNERGLGTWLLIGASIAPSIYDALKNVIKRDVIERDGVYAIPIDLSSLAEQDKRDLIARKAPSATAAAFIAAGLTTVIGTGANAVYQAYKNGALKRDEELEARKIDPNVAGIVAAVLGSAAVNIINPIVTQYFTNHHKRDVTVRDAVEGSAQPVVLFFDNEKRSLMARKAPSATAAAFIAAGLTTIIGTGANAIYQAFKNGALKRDVELEERKINPNTAAIIAAVVGSAAVNVINPLVNEYFAGGLKARDVERRGLEARKKIDPNVAAIVGAAAGSLVTNVVNPIVNEAFAGNLKQRAVAFKA